MEEVANKRVKLEKEARDQTQEGGDCGLRDPEVADPARLRARGVHAGDVGGGLRRALPSGDGQFVKGSRVGSTTRGWGHAAFPILFLLSPFSFVTYRLLNLTVVLRLVRVLG